MNDFSTGRAIAGVDPGDEKQEEPAWSTTSAQKALGAQLRTAPTASNFVKRVEIRAMRFCVDHLQDESYTPIKIHWLADTPCGTNARESPGASAGSMTGRINLQHSDL